MLSPIRTKRIIAALLAVLLSLGAAWNARHHEPAPNVAENHHRAGLAEACEQTGDWVRRLLGPECRAIVRPPLVVAGDLPEAELDRWHREAIAPAAEAMAATCFTTPPDEPITVLLFGTEAAYAEHARRLLGREHVSPYGHYRPHLRMVVVNAAPGPGPLRHELAHALMAFDFPGAPDWLAEGLASLHESCRVRAAPPQLQGETGRRLPALREAIRQNRLPPLRSLVADGDFRQGPAAVNYAQARYLCLYLQRRGALAQCYRAIRDAPATSRPADETVRRVLGSRPWAEIEADFRRWVMQLKP